MPQAGASVNGLDRNGHSIPPHVISEVAHPPKPAYRFTGDAPPAALAHLRDKPVWLTWDFVWKPKKGKYDKPPHSGSTGRQQKGTLKAAGFLVAFDQALATMRHHQLAGIGLSLEHAGLVGIDLDDCLTNSGSFSELAGELVAAAETYCEISPSGEGVHFLASTAEVTIKRDDLGIEVYHRGRYFTLTGNKVKDAPDTISVAPQLIGRLQTLDAEIPKPGKELAQPKPSYAKPAGGDFFANVNTAALAHLDSWVPALHPRACKQATGAWRVTSADLGRNLEEDLAYHPDGIRDHGEEIGLSPIDAVLKYGTASKPMEAAYWLCRQIGVEPSALGSTVVNSSKRRGRPKKNHQTHQTHQTHHKLDAPHIMLATGERARVTDEAIAVLRNRGDIFERSGELVRVANGIIEPIAEDWLLDTFDRSVNFVDGNEQLKDAPQWLGKRITAKKGERGLPELRAVIAAPTMREDGTLLDKPGYDEATGLLLTPGEWPAVPATPTLPEMKAAAAKLWKPFADFPFVDGAARGVHLATILTAVIRQTLTLAPGTSYDAPAAGTGKTLLAQCLQALCGMKAAAIPECRDEEELRKRLLSALRSGQPVLLLDNIRGAFGSPSLEAMLTSETYTDRVLGASHMLSLPVSALVLISGNNFRPAGDLWRRLLTCRIDAETEAPERRSFDLEPFGFCKEHRQEMVAAALTLLRGFVVHGSPRATPDRLASYGQWDDRVRQAVLWLGFQDILPIAVDDPVDVIERAKRTEPERMKLEAVLRAVHAIKADARWRTTDLICIARDGEVVNNMRGDTPRSRALQDALMEVAGDRGAINSRMLGRWIEKQAGRRCEGMWFQKAGTRSGSNIWRINGEPAPEQEDE